MITWILEYFILWISSDLKFFEIFIIIQYSDIYWPSQRSIFWLWCCRDLGPGDPDPALCPAVCWEEWPRSNIKRFVSKFMKTFKTILQCYLIQINISGQFITIIGVTNTIPCFYVFFNLQSFFNDMEAGVAVGFIIFFMANFLLSTIEWILFSLIYSNLFPLEGLIIKYWYLWKHLVTVLTIFMCPIPSLINEKGIKTLGNVNSKSYKQTY